MVTPKENTSENPRLTELAQKIKKGHQECQRAIRSSLKHARDTGTALLEVKQVLEQQTGGRSFLKWVQEHCEFSVSQAQRYMRIADRWNDLLGETKGKELDQITIVEALKILSKAGAAAKTPVKPELLRSSAKEFRQLSAVAKGVKLTPDSPARKFVERQVGKISQQILKLVGRKQPLEDESGQAIDRTVVALAILQEIKNALDIPLIVLVEESSSRNLRPSPVESTPLGTPQESHHRVEISSSMTV